MQIQVLGPGDDRVLQKAVSAFRGIQVSDHAPFLTNPATIALAAMDGPEVIGWAWGTRQRHACGYSQVQLYEIEVSPQHRRRGVGRELLARFLDIVRSEGHRRMWLFTDEANTAAQALYQAAGGEPSLHDDAAFWWQLGNVSPLSRVGG
ncbi:GNAT family N-acetyltransferase [Pseudonocardia sp. TRM90224]|uniref:GNAT family N-acetyltransferase n=1 Tax=Pseudonocardia sp. TRM90224 TaxID=2812678 RepID=UPI001E5E47EE|nr:GNAT family N-acetyltransferase [Pseudonocardia sp. TRM90224]